MHVWRKYALPKDRTFWENLLQTEENPGLVLRETPSGKRVCIECYATDRSEIAPMLSRFGGRIDEIPENVNWMALAPRSKGPILVRDALVILPDQSKAALAEGKKSHPGRSVLGIPAEMAFGTGTHATTATCLRALADVAKRLQKLDQPWDLLDAGTGSGILALAGKQLGASRVHAFDNDPEAVRVAEKNALANAIPTIDFEVRDILSNPVQGAFECIVANMFSSILERCFPCLAAALKPDGWIIISGILHDQAQDCFAAGLRCGLQFDDVRRRGRWVTAIGRHS